MIKITYPVLIEIAMTMGYDPTDSYDTLLDILKAPGIKVTTKAEPPGYILTFLTPEDELLFRLKYADILGTEKIYNPNTIVYET